VVIDPDFWAHRRVLITGHTGFKGAWLSLWLQSMGADVSGIAPSSPTDPSLYGVAGVASQMAEHAVDVRDSSALLGVFAEERPEIVIHLAAQPMVRRSYLEPALTYEINVMGTVNVLEAVRVLGNVRAVVVVTSDKCYDNHGDVHQGGAFTESDPMGGSDPYSSSKGCAELVTAAYRSSYFSSAHSTRVASARAGNVIGGGDWGEDRLIPDIVRAASAGESIRLRNPDAVRPWQHVLNPLSGYLSLAEALWRSPDMSEAWNFGPAAPDARPVRWIVDRLIGGWPGTVSSELDEGPAPPEASYLMLDSQKAHKRLGWSPSWDLAQALERIVDWYTAYGQGENMREFSLRQIEEFMQHRLPYRSAGGPTPDPAAWVDHHGSPSGDRPA
jgi:CDP-glucose 4,6-dehydratase